jgi:hypothetical protein
MKDHLRGLAALVLATTAAGVAWGLTISYTDPTGNDQGAAEAGGKTITIYYEDAIATPLPSEVWFHDERVTTDLGYSVTVNPSGTTGTIDIVVPPKQGGWPSAIYIALSDTMPPPADSNLLPFTYWRQPVIIDNPLRGEMQQKWAGGYIEITGDYDELYSGDPATPLYGRTITVDFDGALSPMVLVFAGFIRVQVPAGTIGTSANLTVTIESPATSDPFDDDLMTAGQFPLFTWCPGGPSVTAITPSEGPLAGDSSSNYMTLWGTRFYDGYTYVSFDGIDGPWVPPAAINFIDEGETGCRLECPLPPQPNKLEIQPEIYIKNAYVDTFTITRDIDPSGGLFNFVYKDQPPSPVNVTGYQDVPIVDGTILLQAEAVDDRTIDRVEFRLWQGASPPDPQGTPPASYWVDYTLLGTDTTWPYEFSWDTTLPAFTDDDYHIIAVAYDDHVWTTIVPQTGNYPDHPESFLPTGGNIVASSAVTVTVDNDNSTTEVDNPPRAQMLVPADGTVLSVGSDVITLSALVADDNGFLNLAVKFFVDGDEVGGGVLEAALVDLGTGWHLAAVTWDGKLWDADAGAFVKVADGAHQITVKVWDDHPAGAGTFSQTATDGVTVTVDSSAVSITSISPGGILPLVGSDLAGADVTTHDPLVVTITGDGFVDGGTTVFFGSVPATNVTWDSATQLTVEVPNLGLPLSAADGAINVGVTTAAGTAVLGDVFYVEDSDPFVEFLGPQLGATVGGLVLLQADARDDSAIASVTYQYSATGAPASWIDIATVDAATDDYPFSYEYDTSALADGTWFFQAIATDDGGNVLTELDVTSVAFDLNQSVYDNPPRVTITSPAQNATVSGAGVILQATVTDAEAAEPGGLTSFNPAALPRFEIVSAGRSETLGTIVLDPASVTWVTTDTWVLSATWDTTEVDGSGVPVYPDGSFYVIRAAATDDADDTTPPLGEYNTGYGAVNVSVRNMVQSPAGLVATPGIIAVTLSWNPVAGAASYNVYRSTTSGSGYAVIGSPAANAYTDSAVAGGSTYYYVVTAVDAALNESMYSNEASATPSAYTIPPGGGGGGGCTPEDTAAPAAALLLLGTVFLVFRRRRPAPA